MRRAPSCLLPGGRLVAGAASGRIGLALRRFAPWVLVSAAVWACYILLFGLALGPVTGGGPTLCLLAGVVVRSSPERRSGWSSGCARGGRQSPERILPDRLW